MNAQGMIQTARWRLWFGLLGGAIAWLLHLLLAYLIAEFGCVAQAGHEQFLGITVLSWILIAMSVVMVAIACAATYLAYLASEHYRSAEAENTEARGAGSYMARTGLIMSALFVLVILVESVPIFFYLQGC